MLAFIVIVSYPSQTRPVEQDRLCTWFEEEGGKSNGDPHIYDEGIQKGRGVEGYRFESKESAETFRARTANYLAGHPQRGSGRLFTAMLTTYSDGVPVETDEISGIVGGGTLWAPEEIPITEEFLLSQVKANRKDASQRALEDAFYWTEQVATAEQIQRVCAATTVAEVNELLVAMRVLKRPLDLDPTRAFQFASFEGYLKTFQWVAQQASQPTAEGQWSFPTQTQEVICPRKSESESSRSATGPTTCCSGRIPILGKRRPRPARLSGQARRPI